MMLSDFLKVIGDLKTILGEGSLNRGCSELKVISVGSYEINSDIFPIFIFALF